METSPVRLTRARVAAEVGACRPHRRLALFTVTAATAFAAEPNLAPTRATPTTCRTFAALVTPASSELRELVERFVNRSPRDRAVL